MKTQLHGSYFMQSDLMPKAYAAGDRWPVQIDLDMLTLQLTEEQAQALFDSLSVVILKQKVARLAQEQVA